VTSGDTSRPRFLISMARLLLMSQGPGLLENLAVVRMNVEAAAEEEVVADGLDLVVAEVVREVVEGGEGDNVVSRFSSVHNPP